MHDRNLPGLRNSRESDDISDRLDIIISLLIPPNRHSENGEDTLQNIILKLCDYDHTTEEIIKATNKSASHVNKELSLLRSKDL